MRSKKSDPHPVAAARSLRRTPPQIKTDVSRLRAWSNLLSLVALVTLAALGPACKSAALRQQRAPLAPWHSHALILRGADCGCGSRMRLCGGGSEIEDDDLPEVDFKLNDENERFNVSLRFPFQIAMGGHVGEERWAVDGVRR